MRRALAWAARLYPRAWRRRYGAEFDALLEQINPNVSDVWNVAAGAFRMQFQMFRLRNATVAFGLVGALAAAVIAARMPTNYTSLAVLQSPTEVQSWGNTLSRRSVAEIILKLDLYRDERQRKPMSDIVEEMRRHHIRIQRLPSGPGIQIGVSYPDAAKAREAARELAAGFIKDEPSLELRQQAEGPAQKPNRIAIVGAGLAIGLLCGLLFYGIRRWPLAVR